MDASERRHRDRVGAVYAVCATACFGLAMWVGAPLFGAGPATSPAPSGVGVTGSVAPTLDPSPGWTYPFTVSATFPQSGPGAGVTVAPPPGGVEPPFGMSPNMSAAPQVPPSGCMMFCEGRASSVPQVPESVAPQTHQITGCVMFCDGGQGVPEVCSVACTGPGGMVPFSTGPMDACAVVCTGPVPVPFRTGPMNGCIVLCGNGDLRLPFDRRAGA